MKISGTGSIVTVTAYRSEPGSTDQGQKSKGSSVSEAGFESAGLRASIDGSSSVDMKLVEQVKKDISEGKVILDPEKLAEAIMGIHAR